MDIHLTTQIPLELAIALIFGAILLGAIVQVGLGMGFGLTVAPLLALIDPALVPAPTLFLGMFTAGWAALINRQSITWSEVAIGSAGRIAGIAISIFIMAYTIGDAGFDLLFGGFVLVAVLLSVGGWHLPFNPLSLSLMGCLSGLMGTITSVGAPPLAVIYQGRDPAKSRATLSAFFSFGCLLSLVGLYAMGLAGARDAVLAIVMLPPMLLGIYLAKHLRAGFDNWYRLLLLGLSGLAGLLLVLRGLF